MRVVIPVGTYFRALTFPPYFMRFVERSSAGGLGFLLQTLNQTDLAELGRFEMEFREGFKFEQMNDLDHAVEIYQQVLHRYPRYAFLVDKHLEFIREVHRLQFPPIQEK